MMIVEEEEIYLRFMINVVYFVNTDHHKLYSIIAFSNLSVLYTYTHMYNVHRIFLCKYSQNSN